MDERGESGFGQVAYLVRVLRRGWRDGLASYREWLAEEAVLAICGAILATGAQRPTLGGFLASMAGIFVCVILLHIVLAPGRIAADTSRDLERTAGQLALVQVNTGKLERTAAFLQTGYALYRAEIPEEMPMEAWIEAYDRWVETLSRCISADWGAHEGARLLVVIPKGSTPSRDAYNDAHRVRLVLLEEQLWRLDRLIEQRSSSLL